MLSLLLSSAALLSTLLLNPLFSFFDLSSEVRELCRDYFGAYSWAIPSGILLTCAQQFLLGVKKTKIILVLNSIGLIISVYFGYMITFGNSLFSPLGIAGLGYAQSIRTMLILIMLMLYFF
ncbi:MATE family efflux transporter [Legionella sp.]|uniref:MATE family efflux transporter n=1 Tax=Legionella sp. TaxID=459 RepID=UPI0039E5DACA